MHRLAHALHISPLIDGATRFAKAHPRATAWMVLSAGVCAVLAFAGRGAGVPLGPSLVLFLVGVLVAALCVMIVTGEEEDECYAAPNHSAPQTSAEPDDSANGSEPNHR
jgi:hypothetical protein